MQEVAKRFYRGNAVTALAAACVFVLQLLLAGVAIGAAPADISAVAVCAQTSQSGGSDQTPVAPAHAGHISCCLAHHSPSWGVCFRSSVLFAPSRLFSIEPAAPFFSVDALGSAPELAPLSARAPPHARS
jgi:hypothetical protein